MEDHSPMTSTVDPVAVLEPQVQPDIGSDSEASDADELQPAVVSEEDEDIIRRKQNIDFVTTISSLRIRPHNLSRMAIPLCRLVPMPMVRSTLECDLDELETKFIHGYEEGARVFYVSISDEGGQAGQFSSEEKRQWVDLWNATNDEFNKELSSHIELRNLVDAKFFICDGNHRYLAWMRHINRLHSADPNWHVRVDAIVLETKGKLGVAMQVMHDINKCDF